MKNPVTMPLAIGTTMLLVLAAPAQAQNTPAAQTIALSGWNLLLVIALSGFFGGMVDGLRAERSYKWRFGSFVMEWGTLGDALVGVTAALAIFAFAENIFGAEKLNAPVEIFTLLKLVAWGVLSGYAGTKLLDTLTSKAIKALAQDAAAQAVKEQTASSHETQENLSEAHALVSQHVALVKKLEANQQDPQALALLKDAERKYDLILQSDPGNQRAQLGLANLHSYRAEYLQKTGSTDSTANFDKAISAVTDLIHREPSMAKAYYNRACYRTLKAGRGGVPEEAVKDLLKSFELDASLKEYWKDDSDLKTLRDDKQVAARVAQVAGTAA